MTVLPIHTKTASRYQVNKFSNEVIQCFLIPLSDVNRSANLSWQTARDFVCQEAEEREKHGCPIH